MQSACAEFDCHLWPDWHYNIFALYLINGRIFGRKLMNVNLCFEILYKFFLKHFTF
jgi:hypothetical protein